MPPNGVRDLGQHWRPGHTTLNVLITAKTRQKVISREADDVDRVDVGRVGRGKKFWTAQNFSPRTTTGGTRGKDVQHTWNTRDNACSGSD